MSVVCHAKSLENRVSHCVTTTGARPGLGLPESTSSSLDDRNANTLQLQHHYRALKTHMEKFMALTELLGVTQKQGVELRVPCEIL